MATTSKKSFSFKTILMAVVVAAASVGATLYYSGNLGLATAAPAEPPAPVIPSPIFVPLQPFTVTLGDSYASRILYVEISLRVLDRASQKVLTDYMPEVRNRVIAELSRQTVDELQQANGREQLSKTLAESLTQPYMPEPASPQIARVLFTAFVIQ